jgi:hypothetical protein
MQAPSRIALCVPQVAQVGVIDVSATKMRPWIPAQIHYLVNLDFVVGLIIAVTPYTSIFLVKRIVKRGVR